MKYVAVAADVISRSRQILGNLTQYLGQVFGIPPRGDLQKFGRTIYPVMVAQAEASDRVVYAYWFGQVVRVNQSGHYTAEYEAGSIARAEEYWNRLGGHRFLIFRCQGTVDWNNPSSISGGCRFEERGSWLNSDPPMGGVGDPGGPSPGPGPVEAGVSWTYIVAAAGAALLLGVLFSSRDR